MGGEGCGREEGVERMSIHSETCNKNSHSIDRERERERERERKEREMERKQDDLFARFIITSAGCQMEAVRKYPIENSIENRIGKNQK